MKPECWSIGLKFLPPNSPFLYPHLEVSLKIRNPLFSSNFLSLKMNNRTVSPRSKSPLLPNQETSELLSNVKDCEKMSKVVKVLLLQLMEAKNGNSIQQLSQELQSKVMKLNSAYTTTYNELVSARLISSWKCRKNLNLGIRYGLYPIKANLILLYIK